MDMQEMNFWGTVHGSMILQHVVIKFAWRKLDSTGVVNMSLAFQTNDIK